MMSVIFDMWSLKCLGFVVHEKGGPGPRDVEYISINSIAEITEVHRLPRGKLE